MIAILDYGAGNLRSVQNTLDAIGAQYTVVCDAEGLAAAHEDHSARRRPFRPDDAIARRACASARRLTERIASGRSVPRHLPRPAGAVRTQRRSPRGRRPRHFPRRRRALSGGRPSAAHGLEHARLHQAFAVCSRASRPNRTCTSRTATMLPYAKRPLRPRRTHGPTRRPSNKTTSSASSFIPRSPVPLDCRSSGISWSFKC